MVDNPLFVLLLIVALIVFFIAVFTFFTYLFLKFASDLKREELKSKK